MVLKGAVKRAGVFVFFDRDGIVERYVEYLLEDLRKNLNSLVVICNGTILPQEREKLERLCDDLYIRENRGLDAAGFREGLVHAYGWERLAEFDEIVLVNDTFYGPFFPFSEIFLEMSSRNVDFWGLTEHYEAPGLPGLGENGVYPSHLQTYFIAVRKSMFLSAAFRKYWEEMPVFASFDQVVGNHEVRFTQHFRNLGFKGEAYCDLSDMREDVLPNVNYYAFLPGTLVRERRFCAIKRKNFALEHSELLLHSGGEELRIALDYVQKHTPYDVSMIWANLLRLYDMSVLKQSLHLNYVLPKTGEPPGVLCKDAVVLIGCTQELLFDEIKSWITALGAEITVKLLTDQGEKAERLRRENPGTDVILCPNMDWWNQTGGYEYACYLHDLSGSVNSNLVAEKSYRYQLQENLIASPEYIKNVLQLFADNPNLGILAPPMPYHGAYYKMFGKTWGPCLEAANSIARELKLRRVPEEGTCAPLMIAFPGWYRSAVLNRLDKTRGYDWDALGRIMPLVAQDCGYYSAWIMSPDYAALEVSNLQYMVEKLGALWQDAIPADCFAEVVALARVPASFRWSVRMAIKLKDWLKKWMPGSAYAWLREIYRKFV